MTHQPCCGPHPSCRTGCGACSIAELKQFTSQLKSLPHITRHINMAEAVSTQMRRKSLRSRVHVEQLLVDGRDVESCCEDIEVGTRPWVPRRGGGGMGLEEEAG